MTCRACGAELSFAQADCPRCGHVPDAFPAPDAGSATAANAVPSDAVPTLAFSSPQQYAATHPADVQAGQPGRGYAAPLPDWAQPQPQPAPRKRRLVPVMLVALVVLLGASGAAAAAYHFGWLVGGARPADVIPASAVSYLQVDLNPSLAQQAAAWQFLHDLPEVQTAVAAGQVDPKAIAWKLMGSSLPSVDYDKDVKPWLGDRVGLAALPHEQSLTGVVAIQVRDAQLAATTLRAWSARADEHYDVTTRDGFVLLTRADDTSFVLKELDAGPLSGNATFAADLASLGDTGVAAGWADLAGLAKLGNANSSGPTAQGRSVAALTFSADTAQLGGKLIGLADTGLSGTTDLGKLPSSTWAAVGFAGGAGALEKAWPQIGPELTDWLDEYGLDKDDLAAILGREFNLGVANSQGASGAAWPFGVGVRSVTDQADRAKAALDRLAGRLGEQIPVTVRRTSDGVVASDSRPYATELAGGASTLVDDPEFVKALPDHATASVAAYVKLPTLYEALGSMPDSTDVAFVKALRGVGGEYVAEGVGQGSWSVRLVRS